MSLKSALFAAVTALVLIVVLGNPPISEAVNDRSVSDAGGFASRGVAGFYTWDLGGLPDDLGRPTVAGLIAFVVLVALLGGLAGRARPAAALVGGWGAAVLAMAMAGGVFALLADDRFYGDPDGINVLDRVTLGMGRGGAPGVWTGWLIGLAAMLGSFGATQPKAVTATASGSSPSAPHAVHAPPAAAPAFGPPSAPAAAPTAWSAPAHDEPTTVSRPVAAPATWSPPAEDEPTTISEPVAPSPSSPPAEAERPAPPGPDLGSGSTTAEAEPSSPPPTAEAPPPSSGPVIGPPPQRRV